MEDDLVLTGAGPRDGDRLDRTELEGLLHAYDSGRGGGGRLTVVHRKEIVIGSHPQEVVTYRAGDDRLDRILVKYHPEFDHTAHGHRAGLEYEAAVYALLLDLGLDVPEVVGIVHRPDGTMRALALGYVDGALHVTKATDSSALRNAIVWIAGLHRATADLSPYTSVGLIRYDLDYFRQWGRRSRDLAAAFGRSSSSLDRLVAWYERHLDVLGSAPYALCHGEYYSTNILYADGRVVPIDWESAALGPGVIDLAMFSDGWESRERTAFARLYASINPTPELDRKLAVARVYAQLRWLGDRGQWEELPVETVDRLEYVEALVSEFGDAA